MLLRVQHVVADPPPLEHPRQRLGDLDVRRSDEHRNLHPVAPLDLLHETVVFLAFRLEDQVVQVVPDDGTVCGDDKDVEPVDLVELVLLGLSRSGHARQLAVHAEVVLDRDRGERLRLAPDLDPFLGLDRLVETVAPPPARHLAPGELVDDHDLAVLADDVLLVPVKEDVGLEELVDDVHPLAFSRVLPLERLDLGSLRLCGEILVVLDLPDHFREVGHKEGVGITRAQPVDALVGEVDVVTLLVHREQQALVEFVEAFLTHQLRLGLLDRLLDRRVVGEHLEKALVLGRPALDREKALGGRPLILLVERPLGVGDEPRSGLQLLAVELVDKRAVLLVARLCIATDRPGDDEGGAGLIDEDRIDLVDDRKVVPPLDAPIEGVDHVVAQVVETELVVRPVGDVGTVGGPPLLGPRLVQVDHPDLHPEE